MPDAQIPIDCPVENPYVRGQLLPDIVTGNDLTENGETIELLPELSGAIEVLASVSGRYGEIADEKTADPVIKSLGCETCTLAEICPVPESLRNSIENDNGFAALNEIVSAAESGDVISKIWLEKTKAEVYEEGLTDDQLSFRVMKKVEEQGVSVEKAGENSVFVIKNGKEGNGASKEVAIIDASGDVEEMISEGDRGSRVTKNNLQTLVSQICNDGYENTINKYNSFKRYKTEDGCTIYKTDDMGTGAYRIFFSSITKGDRVWLIITGASHHDNQESMLDHGLPRTINIIEYVDSLTGSQ